MTSTAACFHQPDNKTQASALHFLAESISKNSSVVNMCAGFFQGRRVSLISFGLKAVCCAEVIHLL